MTIRIIFFATFIILYVSSCKKQTAAESFKTRLLGTWNIDKCTFKNMSTTATVNNYGTYTFTKDGSGSYIYSTNPSAVNNFTWSNTDSTITTVRNNQSTVINVVSNETTKQQWNTSANNVQYDYSLTKK